VEKNETDISFINVVDVLRAQYLGQTCNAHQSTISTTTPIGWLPPEAAAGLGSGRCWGDLRGQVQIEPEEAIVMHNLWVIRNISRYVIMLYKIL